MKAERLTQNCSRWIPHHWKPTGSPADCQSWKFQCINQ